MLRMKKFLLNLLLIFITIYLSSIAYSVIQKIHYYPECKNYTYEERKNFLSKITYIHGSIVDIKDNTIEVYVNYSPRNRWKCAQMESPYEDYLGTTKKTYSVNYNTNTPIYSIYEKIGSSVPNDHTPRQNPSPTVQIPSKDEFINASYSKDNLTIGYRIAVLASKPVLKENSFDAGLVLIYPERDITYSAILFLTILMIIGIGGYYAIETISNILYYLTKNKNINLVITIIRPIIVIGFFIWYFLSHYT